MNETPLDVKILQDFMPRADRSASRELLARTLPLLKRPILVLDDDPTGTQTVHDVTVCTDWEEETLHRCFLTGEKLFFVLTNSRSFSAEKTERVHREIVRNAVRAAKSAGTDFLLLSRGDSTLRGHWPLETDTLREAYEQETGRTVDGEILMPFFQEGGRFTLHGVHYVREGDRLIPAGQTEFANDKSFGYHSSDLREWMQEKSGGRVKADAVTCIPLEMLRARDVDGICALLNRAHDFSKYTVDALDTADCEVFAAACIRSMAEGRTFFFRSAAALPKALGGVSDRALLTGKELTEQGNSRGGLVIAGSHVDKTTRQLAALRESGLADFHTLNPLWCIIPGGMEEELNRLADAVKEGILCGRTAVIQTPRRRFELGTGSADDELRLATAVSDLVISLLHRIGVRPAFLIAKGGITSSDVGTKGLRVSRARVAGQLLPGIPVWKCGEESLYPGLPYVIFPGNVGSDDSLLEAVRKLQTPIR